MVDNNTSYTTSLKKGPWTAEEDEKLLAYIQQNSHGSWRSLPSKAGLQRCGKSCRLRWTNYLRPDIKRGNFSLQEEQTIIQLHALLGNRWATIASHLPKRTDNEIKNYWNTHLKKRLTKMGIDPVTHKPRTLTLNRDQSKEIAKISHMAQWESARLQAEARLVRESSTLLVSKPYTNSHLLYTATPPPPPCLDILKVWEWTCNTPATDHRLFQGISSSLIEPPACRGIMEDNSDHPAMPAEYFPSFAVDGYTDLSAGTSSNNALGGCWGVLEENKQLDNCWSNMGSPMF